VTIPKGATTAVIKFTTALVVSDTDVDLVCTSGGLVARTGVTVLAARLQSVAIAPGVVLGGKSALATVTLSSIAPVGGQVVSLSTSDSVATVPVSVTVPSGKHVATFTVTTAAVSASKDVNVTATCNGSSASATLRVSILTVASVVFKPISVDGGAKASGLVTLTGPAPAGGAIVQLDSDKGAVIVPATVIVPAGKLSAAFSATTQVVGERVDGDITANLNGEDVDGALSVMPPVVSSVVLTPSSVKGGTAATGVVKIAKAVAVPVLVTLSSSASGVAAVPQTVVIPAGAVSVTFQISTQTVTANKTVTISAMTGVTTKMGTLNVLK